MALSIKVAAIEFSSPIFYLFVRFLLLQLLRLVFSFSCFDFCFSLPVAACFRSSVPAVFFLLFLSCLRSFLFPSPYATLFFYCFDYFYSCFKLQLPLFRQCLQQLLLFGISGATLKFLQCPSSGFSLMATAIFPLLLAQLLLSPPHLSLSCCRLLKLFSAPSFP
ncbi:hypothetical protein M9H77_31124 [Catharanthus roseus]|uniref:Uncharacterized protein n=1 Tax=Catharanthus roseus TaxID=4058 RepID=A0ACB9ZZ67_CATRO|nr:hypothetical protein M9H77_31124 [Catharanthus roseus]